MSLSTGFGLSFAVFLLLLPVRGLAAGADCTDVTAHVYFADGSTELTREAKASLKLLQRTAKACKVIAVRVIGLSGDPGDAAANMKLSGDRAAIVEKDLEHRGFKTRDMTVTALGDVDDQNAKGMERPMHRRVDVLVHVISR